jgi:hypothetical protein
MIIIKVNEILKKHEGGKSDSSQESDFVLSQSRDRASSTVNYSFDNCPSGVFNFPPA